MGMALSFWLVSDLVLFYY